MPRRVPATENPKPIPLARSTVTSELLGDVRGLIEVARRRAAQSVNTEMVFLYWRIGQRIRRDVLGEERADYGEHVVEELSRFLTAEYGKGFGRRSLFNMIAFAEAFSDEKIVQSLIAQLTWTHFIQLLPLKDPLQREFYAKMCRIERWSVRTLGDKIRGMLFERTAISRKPAKLAEQEWAASREDDIMSPDLIFRDPYVLDFLGLPRPPLVMGGSAKVMKVSSPQDKMGGSSIHLDSSAVHRRSFH